MAEILQGQKMVLDKEQVAEAFKEFAGLFTEKLDCSQDPHNPILGYDLKGASFQECTETAAARDAHMVKAEISHLKCIEVIADEDKRTGAIWLGSGNSGKYTAQYKTRGAFRFQLEGDKCSGYHVVFDSYNLLPHAEETLETAAAVSTPAVSVKGWAANYCKMAEILQGQKMVLDKEQVAEAFKEFAGLFTEKLDCSQDPHNPILGYDLKGASFQECTETAAARDAHMVKAEISHLKCIEVIADEDKRTGAIWLGFGNSGKYTAQYKTRGAFRFQLEGDKCSGYHVVFDSYNLLPHAEDEAITLFA